MLESKYHLISVTLGWYHWKLDDISSKMRGVELPYRTSTVAKPMPKVLLYTPALTMQNITYEQMTEMTYNLILVRSFFQPISF